MRKKWKDGKSYSLCKEPIGCISPPPPPPPAESVVWPTIPSREQRGYQKSFDPCGDHYYIGYLGQTHVSLPE